MRTHKIPLILLLTCSAATCLAVDPIGHWPFQNSLEDVVGSAHGTMTQGEPVFGVGPALSLNGAESYVEIFYDNVDPYTYSLWVMTTKSAAQGLVTRTDGAPTSTWSHQLRINANNQFEHYVWTGSAHIATGSTVIDPGTWYHVAVAATGSGDMALYVNGELEASSSGLGALWAAGDRYAIGSNSGNAMGFFEGQMLHLRFYDVVVPAEEILIPLGDPMATDPNPADDAKDVLPHPVLTWKPVDTAVTRNVYFGSHYEDVNNATADNPGNAEVSLGQTELSFTPSAVLDLGSTYYWRVDEVNTPPDSTVFKGETWAFEVEPVSFAIPIGRITALASSVDGESDPDNTVNGVGLNAKDEHDIALETMWSTASTDVTPWIQFDLGRVVKLDKAHVWNHNTQTESILGFGIKEALIEYSVDGETWKELGTIQLAQAPGSPDHTGAEVPLEGIVAKYVKITGLSNYSILGLPQMGLSEVRFYAIPMRARLEIPADRATGINPAIELGWRAGREAAQHEVLIGTDPNALSPVATVEVPAFTASLELESKVYWRVDELNDATDPALWEGDLWSFDTVAYITVDDMESYRSKDGNWIWETWTDGFEDNDNGALLGYNGNDMETGIVYDGEQSVPLSYDNTTASHSEASVNIADLGLGSDWSQHGIKGLTLRFNGDPANATQQMYVKINDTRVDYEGSVENIQRSGWQMWYIDLTSRNVGNITTLTLGFDRIGGGGQGTVLIDAIRLYPHEAEYVTPQEPDSASLLASYGFDGNANDSSGNNQHGTENGDPIYGDGMDGQAIQLDGVDDFVEVPDSPSLGVTDTITMTAWIYRDVDSGGWERIIAKSDDSGYDYWLQITSSDSLGGGFVDTEGTAWNALDLAPGTPIPTSQWTHVAIVYDGTHVKAYVNGLLNKSIEIGTFSIRTSAKPLWFGRLQNSYQYGGLIDEARIYGNALSLAEVAWLAGITDPVIVPF